MNHSCSNLCDYEYNKIEKLFVRDGNGVYAKSFDEPNQVESSTERRKTYAYLNKDYALRSLSHMSQMKQDGDLCDVTLTVCGKSFHVHKVVMAACSPYFRAMFTTLVIPPKPNARLNVLTWFATCVNTLISWNNISNNSNM